MFMTDEQIQKFPDAAVGVLVYNDQGEILLMKGSKFGTPWTIPGGHVELDETCEQAGIREIKEEVGVDVDKLEFLGYQDAIRPASFVMKKHFIFLDFLGHHAGGEVTIDHKEVDETIWVDPQKALDTLELSPTVIPLIKKYLDKNKKEKKSFFGKEDCKKCPETKKECDEYKQGWQRALADYKNLQAEIVKRRSEWAQMSEVQILEEFIPVYEHLKMSLTHCHSREGGNPDAWVDGVKHVLRQFADILKSHGVEEIKTIGEMFDPKFHEAVGEEVVEGKEAGEIVKEISGGYKAGDKVIRAARVIIAK
jgi:molecular chaperone GrpE